MELALQNTFLWKFIRIGIFLIKMSGQNQNIIKVKKTEWISNIFDLELPWDSNGERKLQWQPGGDHRQSSRYQ